MFLGINHEERISSFEKCFTKKPAVRNAAIYFSFSKKFL